MPRTASRPRHAPPSVGADGFGTRLRRARLQAGLTQAELAGDHYTKAHVSALEHGLAQPSVTALEYFARRLAISTAGLLGSADDRAWRLIEADLALAQGAWSVAVESHRALLAAGAAGAARARSLSGLAEALCRLDRGREALPAAVEAAGLFERLGLADRVPEARYWQACAAYQMDAADEARSLLRALVEVGRTDASTDPDLRVRALIALGALESREGHAERALAYLEEARGALPTLDDRRRAAFMHGLADTYRQLGDLDGAVAQGTGSLALLRAAAGDLERAAMENELALVHLALGDRERARGYARSAVQRAVAADDRRLLAHALETSAQLEMADGQVAAALELATQAQAHARASGNHKAEVSAGLTIGRARRAAGDPQGAAVALEATARVARRHGRRGQLQDVLTDLAELAADAGDHARAYDLTRQALRETRP
ncbi:MAG: helix-turn-helix domain-containing protein [Candidatus Limnocylindrales bacterium]